MEKLKKLANIIVDHSIDLKKGENVLITCETFEPMPLVKELIKIIQEKEANVAVRFFDSEINTMITAKTSNKKLDLLLNSLDFDVNNFAAFIRIYYDENDYENKNIDPEIIKKIGAKTSKIHDIMIDERKWVLLKYPSKLDAFKAKMPYPDFCEFSMKVMTVDYNKMQEKIKPLQKLMEKTDKVRIVHNNGTDIEFSIKDQPIIDCCGEHNIPDGEIYCGPVKNSVNGVIKYNTPSPYQGEIYDGVTLTFKNGKIINATCDDAKKIDRLNKIFDTDEGAKYIGEFAIGLNPMVKDHMGDILFDEKIMGSIHFTPGKAYKDSYNGNSSSIHWDMVLIERKECGGGALYFDDKLIRKDGKFILKELEGLNK